MPVEYSGIRSEHLAVRRKAGLFDISHMGEIELKGPGALDLIQRLTPNDASQLQPGRSQYSALLTPEATFIDDIMVYCLAPDHYLLCVNASNTEKDFQWVSQEASRCEVTDTSSAWALIALQGPLCREILPASLKKNHFAKIDWEGGEVLLSVTGYTGEDGYEIFCRPELAPRVWDQLLGRGASLGLLPCGLGSRDTLRLEAAYPLYGHEIDEQTTPAEANLSWIVKRDKGDFLGREALSRSPRKTLVGVELIDPGIPRQGYSLLDGDHTIGQVTSGTLSPSLEKGIATAFLTLPLTNQVLVGKKIAVQIRGRRVAARLTPLPFYKRL